MMAFEVAMPPKWGSAPACAPDAVIISTRRAPRGAPYFVVEVGRDVAKKAGWAGDLLKVEVAWGKAEHKGKVRLRAIEAGAGFKARRKASGNYRVAINSRPDHYEGRPMKGLRMAHEVLATQREGLWLLADLPLSFSRPMDAAA